MVKLKEYIVNEYLTRTTGRTKAEREWDKWYAQNVNYRASDITNMFDNFKYVIEVNTDKFTNPHEQFGWVPCADAKQYFWPRRPVETTCVWRFERVAWDQGDKRWHINSLGGEDKIFVATNSDKDATMITLKYMS